MNVWPDVAFIFSDWSLPGVPNIGSGHSDGGLKHCVLQVDTGVKVQTIFQVTATWHWILGVKQKIICTPDVGRLECLCWAYMYINFFLFQLNRMLIA